MLSGAVAMWTVGLVRLVVGCGVPICTLPQADVLAGRELTSVSLPVSRCFGTERRFLHSGASLRHALNLRADVPRALRLVLAELSDG